MALMSIHKVIAIDGRGVPLVEVTKTGPIESLVWMP